ncbi:hypothetical protein M3J09_012325 [Ascochyta lentis]
MSSSNLDTNKWYSLYVNNDNSSSLLGTNLYNRAGTTGALFFNKTDPEIATQRWQLYPVNTPTYVLRCKASGANGFIGTQAADAAGISTTANQCKRPLPTHKAWRTSRIKGKSVPFCLNRVPSVSRPSWSIMAVWPSMRCLVIPLWTWVAASRGSLLNFRGRLGGGEGWSSRLRSKGERKKQRCVAALENRIPGSVYGL